MEETIQGTSLLMGNIVLLKDTQHAARRSGGLNREPSKFKISVSWLVIAVDGLVGFVVTVVSVCVRQRLPTSFQLTILK